ncbi:MAG: DUF1326 domain-containing protein [Hyphomicrobiales bacterium]
MAAVEPWALKGELMLSCNCTVFCPCVLSLGHHPPTEGYCQTWGGVRIDEGNFGDIELSGLNLGLIMEIPGLMSRGNWTAGVYVDERADVYQLKALSKIFSGRAGGTTRILSILVGKFLGVYQAPISYEVDGATRRFKIPKLIEGEIEPIRSTDPKKHTVIENSEYWIASQIIVSKANKSRLRAFGRNWNFEGRSAEICPLDWAGP